MLDFAKEVESILAGGEKPECDCHFFFVAARQLPGQFRKSEPILLDLGSGPGLINLGDSAGAAGFPAPSTTLLAAFLLFPGSDVCNSIRKST
jgi:hypothetical protein